MAHPSLRRPAGLNHLSTYDPDKAETFLGNIAEGVSTKHAAEAAGVPMRTLYRWREQVPAFRELWDELIAGPGTEVLIAEAHRRAVTGWLEPVWYQGKQVGEVRRYSDTLLMAMLKARAPELFKERRAVEVTVTPLTGAELAAARAIGSSPDLLAALETVAAAMREHVDQAPEQRQLPATT